MAQSAADFLGPEPAAQSAADFLGEPPSSGTSFKSVLRNLALYGRAAGEGAFDTLASPIDLMTWLQNETAKGANALLGTHIPMEPTQAQQFSQALTELGAPTPQTKGEQFGTAITRGVTGALAGGGVLGDLSSIPNLIRLGVSGATSAGAAEAARQAGAPVPLQFLAGAVGGLAPSAAEGATRFVGDYGANALRPFSRAGQQQMAANILGQRATNPQAAATNLDSATELVPGSARTSGEASQDIGLLALEKGVRARAPAQFGERISQQNAARQAELADVGGTPSDIEAAETARDQATAPMREAALGNPVGRTIGAPSSVAQDTIDSIIASPAGARESVSKTMRWASKLIGNETDPARLYEIRKDLQLAQQGRLQPTDPDAPNASMLAQTRGQLGQVVSALDGAIESAAPGFQAYLQQYRDLSLPIDQMRTIQGIASKAQTPAIDIASGLPFVGASAFSRALDKGVESGAQLGPDQLQRLEALRRDLQNSQAISSPLIRAPGSDTFQNLATSQLFGRGGMNAGPITRLVTRPFGWATGVAGVDSAVNDILTRAMLDPKFAAALLRQAQPAQTFGGSLRSAFSGVPVYGAGAASGLSTRFANQPTAAR